ncbi:glycosyltransferase 87 family protein [Streptacidiphilus sp. P02-A3a]|uniref:glycosyltransferase 87 family protein n=1 Tax=Streptacidiphilus sp. P02-A3a TaxID=2704468 RepID=UPI0015F7B839|nr:glycosyltransferase 87 family protein [Streptacidiphilus sp. P02-A3a]QMU67563.1 DUF2029 domain-containing protein [Streptacidiphilus sp. P02-A3a]
MSSERTDAPATEPSAASAPWYRPDRRPDDLRAPLALWAVTRLVLVWLALAGASGSNDEAHRLYPYWATELAHGHFPFHDSQWQYPPVAGLVFLAPKALPFLGYADAFVVLMLLCDAVVALLLARASRGPGRGNHGLWLWAFGLPFLIQLAYLRFDLAVTALAVGAVLLLDRAPVRGGALAALGALIKAWPVLVLIGAPRGRATRRSWTSFVASGLAVSGVLLLAFRHAFGFLSEQGSRGIEIESLPGALLLAARHFGYTGTIRYAYGSFQVGGPYVHTLATAALALTALGFGWLLWWRLRARRWNAATAADAALTAMLVFVTTSRVISPQYLVWLIGLGAVCLVFRESSQRPVALALPAIMLLTTLVYPTMWQQLMDGQAWPTALLLLRDTGLLALTLWSAVRLWRATR